MKLINRIKKASCPILLLALGNLSFGQDTQLFENNWYLTDLIINGSSFPPTANSEVQNIILTFQGNYMSTNVCNALMSDNEYDPETNSFSIVGQTMTLINCNLPGNAGYESMYFQFFQLFAYEDSLFSYAIAETGDDIKMLTITSANNDQAIYSSQMLSSAGYERSVFKIFPNPAEDFITISLQDERHVHARLEIYDFLGKLCLTATFGPDNEKIEVQKLSPGIYLAKVFSGQKVVSRKFVKS